jgi:hypothetical protein
MKITINKDAEKVLKKVKKQFKCSDSTAIVMLYELIKVFCKSIPQR